MNMDDVYSKSLHLQQFFKKDLNSIIEVVKINHEKSLD